jgi:hypothetical protein
VVDVEVNVMVVVAGKYMRSIQFRKCWAAGRVVINA